MSTNVCDALDLALVEHTFHRLKIITLTLIAMKGKKNKTKDNIVTESGVRVEKSEE